MLKFILQQGQKNGRVESILHLPDARRRYPDRELAAYNRVSSRKQAGSRNAKLKEKTQAMLAEMGSPVLEIFQGVEEGYLTIDRPVLIDALTFCRDNNCILVTSDHTRYLRSDAYCTNRKAEPTAREREQLIELARSYGVVLATVADPALSEFERHSQAIKRTGKHGRPSIPMQVRVSVWSAVERVVIQPGRRIEYYPSVRGLVKALNRKGLKVSRTTVGRVLMDLDRPPWWQAFQRHADRGPDGSVTLYPSKSVSKHTNGFDVSRNIGTPPGQCFIERNARRTYVSGQRHRFPGGRLPRLPDRSIYHRLDDER
jgi:hypothetical protein